MIYFIAKEFNTNGILFVSRENINRISSDAERTALEIIIIAVVLYVHQFR